MKIDTFTCDTCKRAIDVPSNPSGIAMFPRCVISKNCRGLMSQVSKLFVTDDQYHNVGTSSDAWVQRPMIYDHKQTAARKVWTIAHNLGVRPILNVYVTNIGGKLQQLDETQYSVVSTSDTSTVISFDTARTGVVQCVVRQSASAVVYAAETANPTNAQTIRLLYNQALVVATKTQGVESIDVVLNTTPSKIVTLSANVSALASTPWADTKSVIINGSTYYVVAFDASGLTTGIGTIASFWISSIGGIAPTRGNNYILLAKPPYSHQVDKLVSSVVDVSVVSATFQSLTSLVGSTLYCDPKLVMSLYPPMELIE